MCRGSEDRPLAHVPGGGGVEHAVCVCAGGRRRIRAKQNSDVFFVCKRARKNEGGGLLARPRSSLSFHSFFPPVPHRPPSSRPPPPNPHRHDAHDLLLGHGHGAVGVGGVRPGQVRRERGGWGGQLRSSRLTSNANLISPHHSRSPLSQLRRRPGRHRRPGPDPRSPGRPPGRRCQGVRVRTPVRGRRRGQAAWERTPSQPAHCALARRPGPDARALLLPTGTRQHWRRPGHPPAGGRGGRRPRPGRASVAAASHSEAGHHG